MGTTPLTEREKELLREVAPMGLSYREIAEWLSVRGYDHATTPNALSNVFTRHGITPEPTRSTERSRDPMEQHVEIHLGQTEGVIYTVGPKIRTMEDALREAKVDTNVWEAEALTINSWTTTLGSRSSGSTKEPMQVTNYQVRVRLRRKTPAMIALEDLARDLGRRRAATPLRLKKSPKQGDVLCVVGLVDSHFGKLAWRPETGENYDLKIAETLFVEAAREIIARTKPFGVSRWVLPLGNDFFHFQNPEGTTPRTGNILDRDGRLAKVMRVGAESAIRAVELLAQTGAEVDVVWVKDNHAPEASWWLCRVMQAHFRGLDGVSVDTGPNSRKYVSHGVTLIGLYHGHEIKLNALPRIMADDEPEAFARARFREWLCGHFHKRKRIDFLGTDSAGATTVRVLPSLCGTDAWHYEHGFSGGPKSAEAYLYGKESGYDGHLAVYARDEVLKL